MGRRARIGKIDEAGKVTSVHIQWAKPETTGLILLQVFDTMEKVDKLLDLGDLVSLSYVKGKPGNYKNDYADFGEIVVLDTDIIYLIEDHGFIKARPYDRKSQATIDKDFESFSGKGYDMERFFLLVNDYDEDKEGNKIIKEPRWWLSSRDIDRAIPLMMIRIMLDEKIPESMYSIIEQGGF